MPLGNEGDSFEKAIEREELLPLRQFLSSTLLYFQLNPTILLFSRLTGSWKGAALL
jgi:hypothetical protein